MVRKVLEHETTVWMMFVYTHGQENDVASSLSHVSGQLSGVTCVLSPHGQLSLQFLAQRCAHDC